MTRSRPGSPGRFGEGPFGRILLKGLALKGLTPKDVFPELANVELTPLAEGTKKATRRPQARSTTLTGGLGVPGEVQTQRPSLG